MALSVSSDVVGILPSWFWNYSITAGSHLVWSAQFPVDVDNFMRTHVGGETGQGATFRQNLGSPLQGDVVTVQVVLRRADLSVADSASYSTFVWEGAQNAGYLSLLTINAPAPAVPSQLLSVYQAVVRATLSLTTFHAGLSGTSLITLQSTTRAVRITVTQIPAGVPQIAGNPTYYYNLGYVTPSDGSNYSKSSRVTFASQLVSLPDSSKQLGYTLAPGVIANIDELQEL